MQLTRPIKAAMTKPAVNMKSFLTMAATALLSSAGVNTVHAEEPVEATLSQPDAVIENTIAENTDADKTIGQGIGQGVVEGTAEDNWSFDVAFLGYSEGDRVSASEGIFAATRLFEND